MNVLLILTRTPSGKLHGRKMVLLTIIRALQSLGVSLKIISFDSDNIEISDDPIVDIYLEFPGVIEIIKNIIFKFILGHYSLNECLFLKKSNRKIVTKAIQDQKVDLVISDMVRTVPYVENISNVKWIADLDDLLSERYLHRLHNSENFSLLGNFSSNYPPMIVGLINAASKLIYLLESKRLRNREIQISRCANASVLVSHAEANQLSDRANINVFSIPMGFDQPKELYLKNRAVFNELVFVGSMDYAPNLEAVKHFALRINVNQEVGVLNIIGSYSGSERDMLIANGVNFLGYVKDLHFELSKYSIFIAPILSGTGIKTKVLDAMFSGIPVVGTSKAFEGLSIEHGLHCMVSDSPEEFIYSIKRLKENSELREKIGKKGKQYAEREFSIDVVCEKWKQVIDGVMNISPR